MKKEKSPPKTARRPLKDPLAVVLKAYQTDSGFKRDYREWVSSSKKIKLALQQGGHLRIVRDEILKMNQKKKEIIEKYPGLLEECTPIGLSQFLFGPTMVLPRERSNDLSSHVFPDSFFEEIGKRGPYLRVEIDLLNPTEEIVKAIGEQVNRYKSACGITPKKARRRTKSDLDALKFFEKADQEIRKGKRMKEITGMKTARSASSTASRKIARATGIRRRQGLPDPTWKRSGKK